MHPLHVAGRELRPEEWWCVQGYQWQSQGRVWIAEVLVGRRSTVLSCTREPGDWLRDIREPLAQRCEKLWTLLSSICGIKYDLVTLGELLNFSKLGFLFFKMDIKIPIYKRNFSAHFMR